MHVIHVLHLYKSLGFRLIWFDLDVLYLLFVKFCVVDDLLLQTLDLKVQSFDFFLRNEILSRIFSR